MKSTLQKKNCQKRFKRSTSRSCSRSQTNSPKNQPLRFFVKNVISSQRIDKKDLEGTMNMQKLIKKRIMIQDQVKNRIQYEQKNMKIEKKEPQRFQSKRQYYKQNPQRIIDFQIIKKQIQTLTRQNKKLQQQNLQLTIENMRMKETIQRLQLMIQQYAQKERTLNLAFTNDLLLASKQSNQRRRSILDQRYLKHDLDNESSTKPIIKSTELLQLTQLDELHLLLSQQTIQLPSSHKNSPQQTNQHSILSFSQTFTTDFLQNQLYHAKQKISALIIQLDCQKRKRLFDIQQINKQKYNQLAKIHNNYTRSINEYKQRMKISFTNWCRSEGKQGKENVERNNKFFKKNSSLQLEYSFEEDDCQNN